MHTYVTLLPVVCVTFTKNKNGDIQFADLSEDEMEEILNETESRNTKNVIQVASKLFEDYINNKLNLRSDKSNEEIVQILRKFYCNIRKCNVA